jgi:hypothetical protein
MFILHAFELLQEDKSYWRCRPSVRDEFDKGGDGDENTNGSQVLQFVSELREVWSDFLQPVKDTPYSSPRSLGSPRSLSSARLEGDGTVDGDKLLIEEASAIPREQIEALNDNILTVSKAVHKVLYPLLPPLIHTHTLICTYMCGVRIYTSISTCICMYKYIYVCVCVVDKNLSPFC